MEPPRQIRSAANTEDDVTITRRDYDGREQIVVDFGAGVEAKLDIVGDTAIVVAGDDQYEFEIPAGATELSTNDGMLVIEG